MAESTRSKSNMERIEETISKLATNHLNVSNKLDDLLNRVSAIEANQHNTPSHSSSSANPTPPHTPNPLPRMVIYRKRHLGQGKLAQASWSSPR